MGGRNERQVDLSGRKPGTISVHIDEEDKPTDRKKQDPEAGGHVR